MDDLECRSGQDRMDVGPVADQLMGQLHRFHGCDAARDPEDDRLAVELRALPSAQSLRRMHPVNDCHARYICMGLVRFLGPRSGNL